jgi:hypothetical protein
MKRLRNLQVWYECEPSHFGNLPRLFHYKHRSRSLTSDPPERDTKSVWGSFEVCPPTRTDLEAAPKPFSALFDNLTLIFEYFTAKSFNFNTLAEMGGHSMLVSSNPRVNMPEFYRANSPFDPAFPPNTAVHCASNQLLW